MAPLPQQVPPIQTQKQVQASASTCHLKLGYNLGFLPVPSQVLDPEGTYPGPQGCGCLRQA